MTDKATRTVIVRMTVEYPVEVPADWDSHMIEFHRNDSSWCASNALNELEELYGCENFDSCMCNGSTKFEYVREG
jgi:hypothetical protein